MASNQEPSQRWQVQNGTAWVFTASNESIVRPFILAADAGDGPTDLTAFVAGVDHASYSFLSALRSAGRDLILLGYSNGNASLRDNARVVSECVRRTIAERRGDNPLTVGGLGRGAVVARYALAEMEAMRMDHETALYVSYNGAAPTSEEAADRLREVGGWPVRPRTLKAVSGDFSDELNDDEFDDSRVGGPNSGDSLITKELGSWIIEELR